MDRSNDQLINRLKGISRCRPEIQHLAEEFSGLSASRYDTLAARLTEENEDKALGILLNAAALNRIKLTPRILANTIKTLDIITDVNYCCKFQDEAAIEPFLKVALAEDISWERQALTACLAAEMTVRFDAPRKPVKKVLWQLSNEILSFDAKIVVGSALSLIEDEQNRTKHFWAIDNELLKDLPKERPPVVVGGNYTVRRPVPKLGRNQPCHCGSGKKYKKCCYSKDRELLLDASSYEGITKSQLKAEPALVDDISPVKEMRPNDLKKLKPGSLNPDQLLAAYQQAEHFGLRHLGYEMLLELKKREGKEEFAVRHMKDLFFFALEAQDLEVIDKLTRHIPEDELYLTKADKLIHSLLKKPGRFDELEGLCREAVQTEGREDSEHLLLELCHGFKNNLPGLAVVFGRAAIIGNPERWLDNDVLLNTIQQAKISLGIEPWGDPVEDYLDWAIQIEEEQSWQKDKDKEISQLRDQLNESKNKLKAAGCNLQKKEKELSSLEEKLEKSGPPLPEKTGNNEQVTTTLPPDPDAVDPDRQQQYNLLRKKIEMQKEEIRSQQETKLQLRKELRETKKRLKSADNRQQEESPAAPEEEPGIKETLAGKVQVPEFSEDFRRSLENLPQAIATKALRAAVGFAVREESILKQTSTVKRLPGHFRIRIGIHYRLLVRQEAAEPLLILDLIPRRDLETWIRKRK
ncbi:MAG: SEC-C metal-binding domain-containing protein [Thermodesulfobacteriota bacterium]